MRSAIKISTTIEIILRFFYAILGFVLAIVCLINPNLIGPYLQQLSKLMGTSSLTVGVYMLICLFIALSGFIAILVMKKWSKCDKKKEMILPIIILFFSTFFISSLMMAFTKEDHLMGKHPYFE